MEPKFIKGPWHVSPNGQFNPLHVSTEADVGKQRNIHTVCFLNDTGPQGDTRNANAHLIAASPDLYEALETVRFQCVRELEHGAVHIEEAIRVIDAALKKARGES